MHRSHQGESECRTCCIPLLTSLTIFLLLGQNGDLLTFRKVQEEQHRLLSDYVCKIYIIYLEYVNTDDSFRPFSLDNLHSMRQRVNLYGLNGSSFSPHRLGNCRFYCTATTHAIERKEEEVQTTRYMAVSKRDKHGERKLFLV